MAETKYQPVPHDHKAFLKKAQKRRGFQAAYEALAVEYAVANEMLAARSRSGLTQEVVASRMGTTKSTVSRFESAGKHAPTTLTRAVLTRTNCARNQFYRVGVDQIDSHIPEKYSVADVRRILGLT